MNNTKKDSSLKVATAYAAISVLMYTVIRVLSLMIPLIMKELIDLVLNKGVNGRSYVLLVLLSVIPGIVTLIDVGYFRWINGKVWLLTLNINHQVFTNILRKPYSYFMKAKTGELINIYKSDITKMFSFTMIEKPKLIAQGIVVVAIIILLFQMSPILLLVQLVMLPLTLFPSKFMIQKIKDLSKKIFSNNGLRMTIVSEAIDKIKITKINKFEKYYSEQLLNAHKNLLKSWQSVLTYDVLSNGWASTFVGPLNLGISFFIALTLVNKEALSVGSLVLILSYVPMVTNFYNEISNKSLNYAQKNEEFAQVITLIHEVNEEEGQNSVQKIEHLSLKNLGFKHDEQLIFSDVTLDLKRGQFIGIVGDNGTGKTTFLDLILGLYPEFQGELLVNGIGIETIKQSEYLDRISYMIQDVELPSTTLRKCFLLFNSEMKEQEMIEMLKKLKLWDTISNRDGLDTELNSKATNFSGGEKRKLYLAMVLSKDADILVLDEITANIDKEAIGIIHDVLKEKRNTREQLIIAISHDKSLSELYDEVIDMNRYKVKKFDF